MGAPLPPLPPVPGTGWDVPPAGRSMVDLLVDQHHELRSLCADLADLAGPPARRRRLADVLTASLTRHLSAEAQYLYPTVRAVLPDGEPLAEQEIAADLAILHTLRRVGAHAPSDEAFEWLVHTLDTQVARHVAAASREIFPRLRARCTDAELARLGNRVEIALEAAPTRPHLHTPVRPPWNKLIDPGVGVIDKVRDVFRRRTTYASDL